MLKLVFLLSAIICAFGAAVPSYWLNQSDGRVVGGKATTIESYPFVVTILFIDEPLCGGSIVSETRILTAAHCVIIKLAYFFSVRAGSTFSNEGGVKIPVISFVVHGNYDYQNMTNDIAIFCLAKPLQFRNTIKPIALPTVAPVNGAFAFVVGWGVSKFGERTAPKQLHMAELLMVGNKECRSDKYKYGAAIKGNMTCAAANGKDACQGDSGGPLVSGGTLAGIVSWGIECAKPGYPGVYTEVASFYSWIKSNIDN